MDAERYRRLRRVVLDAQSLRGAELDAFLARVCEGDAELAAEARRLVTGSTVPTGDVIPGARAVSDAPPIARLGPYRVVREVGRGGMGVVYEAVDERDGSRVALKVVDPRLVGEGATDERFVREAAAGTRVVHENVVRTLAVETLDDGAGPRRVLVSEFVQGRSLRDLLRSLRRVPDSLLREIALGAARGLAAIHAAAIVHRDLKPENILLSDDQRVRIADLGVARIVDAATRLTREGEFVGSLLYASPEQCEGEAAGPAADLYSLGVTLYELATGVNPFERPSAVATIGAQIRHHPPPPGEAAPDLTEFLGAVIERLLRKEPSQRFESADALAAVLAAGESGVWWRERTAASAVAPRVPVAQELSFHGRAAEMAVLRAALGDASEGRGRTVLVEGEAGLGKTRFVAAFLEEAAASGARLLYGAISTTGGPAGLAQALLSGLPPRDVERTLRTRLGVSEALAAAYAAFLRGEPAPSGGSPLDDDAVATVSARLLQSLAAERPCVLVVDDVHLAADSTRALLLSLARNLATERVVLLLATRPGFPDAAVADLSALCGFRRLVLSRLGSGDILAILRDALGDEDLARRAAMRITAKSGGVPLFIAAMLGALRDGGFVMRTPEGRSVEARPLEQLEVPMALRDLLAARLAGLPAGERAILDVASVQGDAFDASVAAAALGIRPVQALQQLADLERRLGLVRSEGRRFRFDHQLLAAEVHDALPQALREEYHLRTAEAIEAAAAGSPGAAESERIATHYLRSAEPARAAAHVAKGMDRLSARNELDAALDLARIALAAEGALSGTDRAEVLVRVAEICDVRARRDLQLSAGLEAHAIARRGGSRVLRARVHSAVGNAYAVRGRDRLAVARFLAAVRLSAGLDDTRSMVRASAGLASSLLRLGRPDEALARLESVPRLAVASRDVLGEQAARLALGQVLLACGRLAEARSEFERCLVIGRADGQSRAEARAEATLALVDLEEGRWDAAQARFERARDLARRAGDRLLETQALGNLSLVQVSTAHYADAAATVRELQARVRETGDRNTFAVSWVNLGLMLGSLGDAQGAVQCFRTALEMSEETGYRRVRALAVLCLGESARERGDLGEAEWLFRDAEQLLTETGEPATRAEAMLCRAAVARELGQRDAATELLDEAVRVAREIGSPGLLLGALAARTTTPDPSGTAVPAARAAIAQLGARAGHGQRLRAHHDLWLGTGDLEVLEEARRLLAESLELAPPDRRRPMLENVRLHRDVVAACRAAGLPEFEV